MLILMVGLLTAPALAQPYLTPKVASVYRGKVVRVVDGDTVDVLLYLGFDVCIKHRVRMLDVYAAESREKNGYDHTSYLSHLLPEGAEVVVRTNNDSTDKYGRVVAEIWASNIFVNAEMRRAIGQPQGLGLGSIKPKPKTNQ